MILLWGKRKERINEKKIIFTVLLLVFTACTNNNYKKLVDEKFKKSEYDKILVKKEAEKDYYKYDSKKKFWEEVVFLFIEDNKKDGVKLYMGINYRGKDWLYMRSIEFIGDEGSLFNDFYDYRTFNPIWKDNTTLSRGVEEKILFPLKESYINELEYILENKNLNITLRSDYDERLDKRKLSEKEVFKMKEILNLYKKLQTKNEEKENGN